MPQLAGHPCSHQSPDHLCLLHQYWAKEKIVNVSCMMTHTCWVANLASSSSPGRAWITISNQCRHTEIVTSRFAALQAWFVHSCMMYFWIHLYCMQVCYTMYKV